MTNQTPLRVRIRTLLKALLPKTIFRFVSSVWRKTGAGFFDVQGIVERYTADFIAHNPKIVQAGPFVGMNYVDSAVGSNYIHKLIGSYEAVLHPVIKSLQNSDFNTVLDIGSAEGYYLIGLGRMFPQAHLIGFELEDVGRSLTKEMYQKNNLYNQLDLQEEATASNIGQFITSQTLLICDCEGAELDILDIEKCPALSIVKSAIIELHDDFRPGIKQTLTNRFSKTHTISIIKFQMAEPDEYPYLARIKDKSQQYELLRERGIQDQEWMILEKITF